MSELICPKCGRTSDKVEFIEAFCIDCYPDNIKCPRKIEIEQCRSCEKIKIRGEWTRFSRKAINDYVISKCKGDFEAAEYDLDEQMAEFDIGKKRKKKIELVLLPVLCQQCSRMSGGYFQGIVQLRGDPRKVGKWADRLYEKLSKRTFIAKEEEKHGGIDIYVGSSKAVVELLSELRIDSTMTTKLAGVEKGKRYYRTTFLIRL